MTHFKKHLHLASCLTLVTLASPAHAENLFLLQLGLFSNKESADSSFKETMERNEGVLKGKRYIPQKSRALNGDEDSWRVLVGPFENRKMASRTCAELKEKGQDCFVVETAAVNISDIENARVFVRPSTKPSEAESKQANTESQGFNPFGLFNSEDSSVTPSSVDSVNNASNTLPSIDPNANININTRSVYAKKSEPKSDINIVDSIGGLFDRKKAEAAKETAELNNQEAVKDTIPPTDLSEPLAASESTIEQEKTGEKKSRNTPKKGDVEIAEAIPVPLTDPEDIKVTQSDAPVKHENNDDINIPKESTAKKLADISDYETKAIVEKPEVVSSATSSMKDVGDASSQITSTSRPKLVGGPMLQMSIFENDRLAFQCLNNIQQKVAASSLLHTRIIKSTTGQAIVRLGPINDPELETAICDVAASCGKEIRCRMISENDSRKISHSIDDSVADKYAPMPRNLTNYENATPATTTSLDSQGVWVQLGTSSSESEAKDRYDTIAKENVDVLKDFKPVINTPEYQSLAGKVYRIRIGPFKERKQAQNICGTLSSRGIGCLVLSK